MYLVAGLNTKAIVYYVSNLSKICEYNNGGTVVRAIKFFPSNDKFIYTFESGTVRIVGTTNCSLIASFNTGHSKVLGADFSFDGKKLLTCGDDQTFRVWNISQYSTTTPTTTPQVLGGGFNVGEVVRSCKFSFDDHVLVGIQSVNTVKIYGGASFSQL